MAIRLSVSRTDRSIPPRRLLVLISVRGRVNHRNTNILISIMYDLWNIYWFLKICRWTRNICVDLQCVICVISFFKNKFVHAVNKYRSYNDEPTKYLGSTQNWNEGKNLNLVRPYRSTTSLDQQLGTVRHSHGDKLSYCYNIFEPATTFAVLTEGRTRN
jgi:hypothetical protein